MLTSLFNGCSRSAIKVTPKNWKTEKASLKKPWRIHYRFYDPVFKDNPKYKKGKQVPIRGMNVYATREERQEVTKALIEKEKYRLDQLGYNPITGQTVRPELPAQQEPEHGIIDITADTPFIDALYEALPRLVVVPKVRIDIKSVIGGVEIAAGNLLDAAHNKYYTALEISQISRRHIKNILDLCAKTRKRWSAKRHNMYKCYLSMLFSELLQLEAVEMNPTRDIPSKVQPFKRREELTKDELKRVDEHLYHNYYAFWRYWKIFFYSGSRSTELLQLRKDKKINLQEQTFIIRVIKGNQDKEDLRGISNEVLYLWQEIWDEAKSGQFLFSKGLVPGNKPIRNDQIGRRWNAHVKIKLSIKKDFYSLKATHTDAIADKLDIQHAQTADGHTTPVVTLKHYAKGEKKRQIARVNALPIKMY